MDSDAHSEQERPPELPSPRTWRDWWPEDNEPPARPRAVREASLRVRGS